jgi:RNA-directed DNA polymerase
MTGWRPQLYRRIGKSKSIDADILRHAVKIGSDITKRNAALPPIFTLRHLAHLSDVDYGLLRVIVSRKLPDPYKTFRIRKRRGSVGHDRFRRICVPDPELMRVQRWISKNVLAIIKPHAASVAYAKDSQILRAAEVHCGSRWLVKLDVSNFFESISEIAVYRVFREWNYQSLVSFELARLCTRLSHDNYQAARRWSANRSGEMVIPEYTSARMGYLPQGAPTSPMLSNFAARNLDIAITDIAEANSMNYTRYADDVTLSTTDIGFTRRMASAVIGSVYSTMRRNGLSPNIAKTQVVPPGARKIVLGLLVDGESPRLTREFRGKLRQHLYYLGQPDGPRQHARNRGFESIIGLRNHIGGLICFAEQIEPIVGREFSNAFAKICWPI